VPRLAPLHWKRLRCVFEQDGFVFKKRTAGSHWAGEKTGVTRPLIIPEYAEVGLDVIRANMRTASMSRERFLALLARC